MITEDHVSFETAKLLKEKGFNEPCIWLYSKKGEKHYASDYHSPWPNNDLAADEWSCCTQAMAMKWLRDEKRTSIIIEFDLTKRGYCPYVYQLDYDMDWIVKWRVNTPMKYEQACETAIKYCLENLI